MDNNSFLKKNHGEIALEERVHYMKNHILHSALRNPAMPGLTGKRYLFNLRENKVTTLKYQVKSGSFYEKSANFVQILFKFPQA